MFRVPISVIRRDRRTGSSQGDRTTRTHRTHQGLRPGRGRTLVTPVQTRVPETSRTGSDTGRPERAKDVFLYRPSTHLRHRPPGRVKLTLWRLRVQVHVTMFLPYLDPVRPLAKNVLLHPCAVADHRRCQWSVLLPWMRTAHPLLRHLKAEAQRPLVRHTRTQVRVHPTPRPGRRRSSRPNWKDWEEKRSFTNCHS